MYAHVLLIYFSVATVLLILLLLCTAASLPATVNAGKMANEQEFDAKISMLLLIV